jgi:hypothetical protein
VKAKPFLILNKKSQRWKNLNMILVVPPKSAKNDEQKNLTI